MDLSGIIAHYMKVRGKYPRTSGRGIVRYVFIALTTTSPSQTFTPALAYVIGAKTIQ
jgi:hypothetical protein